MFDRPPEQSLQVGIAGDVAPVRDGLSAVGLDQSYRFPSARFVKVGNDDPAAFSRQSSSDHPAAAKSTRGRDDGDLLAKSMAALP